MQLLDSAGRVRFEISIANDDAPQLILRDADGNTTAILTCDPDGTARFAMGPKGHGLAMTSGPTGDCRIEIQGSNGGSLSMRVDDQGVSELSLRSPDQEPELLLRASKNGEAELRVGSTKSNSGASMQAKSNGTSIFRLTGSDGITGPEMSVLEDETSQIAIHGGNDKSGPSLIRMPDGVSIVSARLPSGNPGASMVVSPDGRSVIAVTSENGSRGAELRTDARGVPSIRTYDPDAKPPKNRTKPVEKEPQLEGQASLSTP